MAIDQHLSALFTLDKTGKDPLRLGQIGSNDQNHVKIRKAALINWDDQLI
jgi:hypothetical protein